MFEFHGWANIQAEDFDDLDIRMLLINPILSKFCDKIFNYEKFRSENPG